VTYLWFIYRFFHNADNQMCGRGRWCCRKDMFTNFIYHQQISFRICTNSKFCMAIYQTRQHNNVVIYQSSSQSLITSKYFILLENLGIIDKLHYRWFVNFLSEKSDINIIVDFQYDAVFQLGPFHRADRPPFSWCPVPFSWRHALFQSLYVFFNKMYCFFWLFVMIRHFSRLGFLVNIAHAS
jgi:hypothetical protein